MAECSQAKAAVCIRPLEEKDLDTVTGMESLIQAEPWSRTAFAAEVSIVPSRFFVIEVSSPSPRVVGYGGLRTAPGESYLINFGIHADDRRKGFGKILLSFLAARAREQGSLVMHLEVRADNEGAIKFYESTGFRNAGRRPGMYPGGRDGFMMTKELS